VDIRNVLPVRWEQVPTRLRLVGLLALLRCHLSRSANAKLVIFMSSCDAVEFLHTLLTQVGGRVLKCATRPYD
jgi:hypothetical protein